MEEIAEVYARSLFEVARSAASSTRSASSSEQFADALDARSRSAVFFFSPYFSTDEKKAGLRRAVTGADPGFMNFLRR